MSQNHPDTSTHVESEIEDPHSSKSPAFQFYPKDFLTDSNVIVMSLQERGAYISLICQCWLDGTLPDDLARCARIVGTTIGTMKKLWPAIRVCFKARTDGRLVHPRLERERKKQREWLAEQSEHGRRGAHARWGRHPKKIGSPSSGNGGGIATPMPKNASSIPSASSSSFPDSSQKTEPANARSKRPIFSGTRFVVFEWQLDDLRRLLGAHFDSFDVHSWFFDLNAQAEREGATVPQRDGGKWLQDQAQVEALRRGIPVAAALPPGKTAGNLGAAARFIARGAR